MTDPQTVSRFIILRSQGWSFNRIASELNVSKPTLIKWSRQHQFEIANLRATETEALAESVFGTRHERWRALADRLEVIEAEIAKRDLKEISAARLHGIAAQLRAEIDRQIGPVAFIESNGNVPNHELVLARQAWTA